MATKTTKNYELWENLKTKYPDTFVLLQDPIYEPEHSPFLKKGIFIYKNKNRRKVIEKDVSMNLGMTAIQYTGGKRLDAVNENLLLL